ncbi:MAG: DUF4338 domain-containing protein [Nitrosopumilus sp.]|nr:DUF4338 domain-containing protein [Nitrosopumilus sp.]
MDWPLKVQGRFLDEADVQVVCNLLGDHPEWGRTRLSEKLCQIWNWRRPDGQWKNIACRELLRKLEGRGLISLPPRQRNGRKRPPKIAQISVVRQPVEGDLASVQPLQIVDARNNRQDEQVFNYLLNSEHYLGFSRPVGQNMKYLVRAADGRVLACLLFGAAAWKVQDRDRFIGWNALTRETYLNGLTNNTRFLICPWVQVKCLASKILSQICRRLPVDWERRYGHRVVFIETFVERQRFCGTCYQAANFLCVGQTQGRSRQDRFSRLCVPIKDIYVYPLCRNFRRRLGVEQSGKLRGGVTGQTS